MAVGENARPPATHKQKHGSEIGQVHLRRLCICICIFRLQSAADPLAAALGDKAVVVVLLAARDFAKGAAFNAEPVGPLHQAHDLVPSTARGRHPEADAKMAFCPVLRGWATDAVADALIKAAPPAQPPAALLAGQQHRSILWQVLWLQLAVFASLSLGMRYESAW